MSFWYNIRSCAHSSVGLERLASNQKVGGSSPSGRATMASGKPPPWLVQFANMHYVYLLRSLADNNFYTGSTSNLRRRLTEHNQGKNLSTKARVPFKLVYYEAYLVKGDAINREKFLKTTLGKRFIKKQLKNYLEESLT